MASYDIAATGTTIFVRSSVNFPQGFTLEGLADDTDPIGFAELTVAEVDTNVNGDLVVWGKPQVLNPTIAVVPGSPGDENFATLLAARKNGVREVVEISITYPDGSGIDASEGVITVGTTGKSVASNGRIATRSYQFAFAAYSERRA